MSKRSKEIMREYAYSKVYIENKELNCASNQAPVRRQGDAVKFLVLFMIKKLVLSS
jgi:hypothetical protein